MLLNFILYFGLASAITILAIVLPGMVRARTWLGLPVGIVALALAAAATVVLTNDRVISATGLLLALGLAVALKVRLREWSLMASQALATMVLACVSYLTYAVYLTVYLLLAYNPLWFLSS